MSDPILCHDCGHDIDDHRARYMCNGCGDEIFTRVEDELCYMHPSDIARAYGEEQVLEVIDSHRCDEQAERAYRRAVTAEADARRLHSVRGKVAAEAILARQAHRSYRTDHFAHDYCRWVGMSEAYQNVLNILDRRDDD